MAQQLQNSYSESVKPLDIQSRQLPTIKAELSKPLRLVQFPEFLSQPYLEISSPYFRNTVILEQPFSIDYNSGSQPF